MGHPLSKGKAKEPCTYYTFQHRTVGLSKWLDPNGRIYSLEEALTSSDKEVRERLGNNLKDQLWCNSCFGHFGLHPESDCWDYGKEKVNPEPHQVHTATGSDGYWTLETAQLVLKQARKNDKKGKYDYTDNYRVKCQRARHEFRIIKVTYTPDVVEVVEEYRVK